MLPFLLKREFQVGLFLNLVLLDVNSMLRGNQRWKWPSMTWVSQQCRDAFSLVARRLGEWGFPSPVTHVGRGRPLFVWESAVNLLHQDSRGKGVGRIFYCVRILKGKAQVTLPSRRVWRGRSAGCQRHASVAAAFRALLVAVSGCTSQAVLPNLYCRWIKAWLRYTVHAAVLILCLIEVLTAFGVFGKWTQ